MSIVLCPVCEKSFDSEQTEAMPFCSHRCRRIDLSRWLDERYSMPIERIEESDGIEPPECIG